jgi:hypothetical protein
VAFVKAFSFAKTRIFALFQKVSLKKSVVSVVRQLVLFAIAIIFSSHMIDSHEVKTLSILRKLSLQIFDI